MKFIFCIIGGGIGALIDSYSGFCFGVAIGFLFAYSLELKKLLRALEGKVSILQSSLINSEVVLDETTSSGIEVDNAKIEKVSTRAEAVDSEETPQIKQSYKKSTAASDTKKTSESSAWQGTGADETEKFYPINKLTEIIKNFFTTGNVVAKIGVIILFFGVAFLLKYAAQSGVFPIELRLATVAASAIVMFILGWRLRFARSNYALVLQGGAVGVLYLTVFSAAKFYAVLPLVFTFFVMVALVVFSCLLAVLQNSRSLACFAVIGGFLAPILISGGSGSHIALFSYYAFLNASIFGIAWFKAWQILNWLGFVFTFVIASLWGHDAYQAEYFNTTEPFLILFFLYYVVISILFAHKQPPHLKGLVDGSLVFGVPLVGFTLQSLLVYDYEFGQALSALALGVMYILLARWLWNKQVARMRLLSESFLALGVIFGSLAIPFALDDNWTATVWALEGAGISWIGIRQKRFLARIFGLMLQVGGGFIFLESNIIRSIDSIPILNSAYIGSFLLSVGGLFSAYIFYKYKARLKEQEQQFHSMLLIWALLWWFCSGFIEIREYVSSQYEMNTILFFITISMLTISLIARSLEWKEAEFPPILLLPAMYGVTLIQIFNAPSGNLLSNYGFLSWVTAFIIQMLVLYRCERIWDKKLLFFWHTLTMYLFVFLCCWIITDAIHYLLSDGSIWEDIIWGLIPAFGVLKMIYLRDRLPWPVMDHPQSYVGKGLLPIVIYLGLWVIFACYHSGDPSPCLIFR